MTAHLFFKSITFYFIISLGDQTREAPAAFCSCSLCGETTAVYGFAEVVTARGRNQWHAAKWKGRGLRGTEKKNEPNDDAIEGGRGRKTLLFVSDNETGAGRSFKLLGCFGWATGRRAFPTKNTKIPRRWITIWEHVFLLSLSLFYVCGFFCDLLFCHLPRVVLATFLQPRARYMVWSNSFAWPPPPAEKDKGGECKAVVRLIFIGTYNGTRGWVDYPITVWLMVQIPLHRGPSMCLYAAEIIYQNSSVMPTVEKDCPRVWLANKVGNSYLAEVGIQVGATALLLYLLLWADAF